MPPEKQARKLRIGDVAKRTGSATSTLRFYEDRGLITSNRNEAGYRHYDPEVIRRVSFIRTAQRVGLTLTEIGEALASLPDKRTPTASDWARLARAWGPALDERIATLTRLREQLDTCIGCGCLSLRSCGIWNPDDIAATTGTGPRYLLSDQRPPSAADQRRGS